MMKVKLLLLLCFTGIIPPLSAQIGCVAYMDSISSSKNPRFLRSNAIVKDSKGNFYLTGEDIADTLFYRGNTIVAGPGTLYLIKLDKDYNLLWIKKDGNGVGHALAVDKDDNLLVGGWASPYLTFDPDTLTFEDGGFLNSFISKFDEYGKHIWSKRIHTPGMVSDGSVVSLATDTSANIFFGGYFGGSISYAGDTITTRGAADNYWGKMDSGGQVEWIRAAGSSIMERGPSVATDVMGNLYLAGSNSNTTGYLDTISFFDGYGFIVKYSKKGQLKWFKKAEKGIFSSGNTGKAINILNDKLVITGSFIASNDTITIAGVSKTTPFTKPVAFALKLDTLGNGLWMTELISWIGNVEGLSINFMQNGDIAALSSRGYYLRNDTLDAPNYKQVFFNLDGVTGQIKSFCYPVKDLRMRSIITLNDTIIATGAFSNYANGPRKIFIAEVFPGAPNIKLPAPQTIGLSAFPNPVKEGNFKVVLPYAGDFTLELYHINGLLLKKQRLPTGNLEQSISVHALAEGLYLAVIRSEKAVFSMKLIVE